MNSKNLVKNLAILAVGIAVGFVINLFVFQQDFALKLQNLRVPANLDDSSKTGQSGHILSSLMIDFGDGKIINCNSQELAEGQTAFDLLEVCSKNIKTPFDLKYKDYPEFGVFIEQIGDKKSGNDMYWQFWINNEYAQVGAGQYQLRDKDVIEWKFIKGQL